MTHLAGWSFVVAGIVAVGAVAAPFDVELVRPCYEGEVRIDGSTLVYLIADATAAQFKKQHPKVEVSVGKLNTNGGFDRFSAGETHINTASRPIDPLEAAACQANGVQYLEMQVGWDAAVVVVHKDNNWATKLTLEQLHKAWRPGENNVKNAKKWSDLDARWPKEEIQFAGVASHSALGKVFAKVVNGDEDTLRDDYDTAGSSTVLAEVLQHKHVLAFVTQGLYERHKERLNAVAVTFADGKAIPYSAEAVRDGTYPLRRPLYYYVNRAALKEPQVLGFVAFQLHNPHLVREARLIEISAAARKEQLEVLAKALRK